MVYLKLKNNVVTYPFSLRLLRLENPNVSFPSEISNELLAQYGVYPVTLVERPSATLTQDAVEQTPQLTNGVWTQVWTMVDVSAEETARRQADATAQAETNAVALDAFVKNFISMTPSGVENYVTNNTATLAEMRALVRKMAVMLLVLAKREFR